jgi:hypothetical protein
MSRLDEQLSEQFHQWELRGRGWQVFSEPVCLEPPFRPFHGHYVPNAPPADDGRKPTFFSSLAEKLSNKLSTASPPASVEPEPEEEPEPTPLIRSQLIELQASLPDKLDISKEAFEQFLFSLSFCREPIAFELLGTRKKVTTQFAAAADDAPLLRRQLQAYFPEAVFVPREGALEQAWNTSTGDEVLAVDFGLAREFMLPLASGKLDPFIGIVGALAELQQGELGLFQVLFQPADEPWAESIVRSVTHADGKPFFVDSPELAGAAENKVARPLFAAVVRIFICAGKRERMLQLAHDLAGSLRVFAQPQGNELIPLKNDDYGFENHIEDVLRRQSRRSGMILNSDELVGFVHLPSSAVRSQELLRDSGRTKAAPGIVRQSPGVVIGDNEHNGETIPVFLNADQRVRHTHIVGSNGTGKSSLLLNLIRQDILKGDGVGVLDPYGDLIDQILGIIPADRIGDVVLVDISDEEFPIGFNILQANSEKEKRLLASDLVSVFRRLSTSWGDQMDTILQNAILAFLESSRGGTLADLRRFLHEKPYRSEFLETVQDPELLYYWREIFTPTGSGKSVLSVVSRLNDFFNQKALRNMVSQRQNRLDFADIMDSRKIFLAKLSEGLGGEDNSYLLGTLLIAKFQQLTMARQEQKIAARRDFWLYIDEFQHFISPSMTKILTGARKYRLGFTLSHQRLHQLQGNAEVADAVMTEPCTRIVLRVGDEDAKKLGEGFESFDAKSLTTLEKFHAIARVERNDFDFNLALRKPELSEYSEERKAAVVAASRATYATARSIVEADLLDSLRRNQSKPLPMPQPTSLPPNAGVQVFSESPKHKEVPKAAGPPPTAEVKPPVVAEIPKAEALAPKHEPPRDLGRGGAQHQAIQQRIKQAAEELGFRSMIEKQVLDGQGSVDLWLEHTGQAIACEISISTTIDHEVRNVAKCLKAGVSKVMVICLDEERLRKIGNAVSGSLGSELAARVEYFQPDQFIAYLKALPAEIPKTQTSMWRGYKIKRVVSELSPEQQKEKEAAAIRVIADSMRK